MKTLEPKYELILEGRFTGSGEYWKQEYTFETLNEVKEYLNKRTDYDNYKVYEITKTEISL